MAVFAKGEYVVCGNKGVCMVEDITTLNISQACLYGREYRICACGYGGGIYAQGIK